ncbi:AcvB/VirJ family lysyl-phosphatidylglycerol hydrolase [Pseudomonas sp.]|uniref:AcvB/VirJ family lysyl-phosphatidylglycerol hydrolase n=1 Tax=Pseudomonas sp. TaxID=306 RepID=UPI0028A5DD9E|nr:AcvB/VirJ family lysyl-phosphatidylglycerol hydrolase [Pseudomonas sp.]
MKRQIGFAGAALVVVAVAAGMAFFWHPRHDAAVQSLALADGTPVLRVGPATAAQRVLVLVSRDQALDAATLERLAASGSVALLQLPLSGDCTAQQSQRTQAERMLGGAPTLVAGLGPAAASAWRWLAGQGDDSARALSVGFDLEHPDCDEPLPQAAPHGHWFGAWNDNPGDANAVFLRSQANAEPRISAYGTPLTTVLGAELARLLSGQANPVPVVEHPTATPSDTLTLFYSGDGGWRDLDRASAKHMAAAGYPVVGIDTLRYYWQHKSAQQSADDLSRLMQHYRDAWHINRFVLAGYSFGADVLPAIYNRLPRSDQAQVDALLLLAFARSGSFEIEVGGWLGQQGAEAATGPEMRQLPAAKVFCVYGSEEAADSGCTQDGAVGERLQLAGGHHFDGDYDALADKLLAAIRARQPKS